VLERSVMLFASETVDALLRENRRSMLNSIPGLASKLHTSFRSPTKVTGRVITTVNGLPFRRLASPQEPSTRFRMEYCSAILLDTIQSNLCRC